MGNAGGLSQVPSKNGNTGKTERNVAVNLGQRAWGTGSTRLWRNLESDWRLVLQLSVDTFNILSDHGIMNMDL